MKNEKPKNLLDSFAILAYLNEEPGCDEVEALFYEARQGYIELVVSTINLGEVYYSYRRRKGETVAEDFIRSLNGLPIASLHPTWVTVLRAARIKAQYPLSYADAFAIATAQEEDAVVVTGDPEFVPAEAAQIVRVLWIPHERRGTSNA